MKIFGYLITRQDVIDYYTSDVVSQQVNEAMKHHEKSISDHEFLLNSAKEIIKEYRVKNNELREELKAIKNLRFIEP